ncbi:hypothetical protein BDP67DRAFT_14809 [Colletotrichum lupini]|nr:hypothetical protein BDP67DRAFT_14809 [Colletotrichum lupini]
MGSRCLSVCLPTPDNAYAPLADNIVSSKLHTSVLSFLWTMSESPQLARLADAARCNLHRSALQTPAACAILTRCRSQIDLASRLHIARRQVQYIRSRCRPSDLSEPAIFSTTGHGSGQRGPASPRTFAPPPFKGKKGIHGLLWRFALSYPHDPGPF